MPRAVKGLGTTISIGGTLVGNLTDISGVDMSVETMEVQTLDSTVKEYITGIFDGGEVGISGFFEPGNAGQVALLAAFNAGTEAAFVISFPTGMGATWMFNGIVKQITTGAGISDPVSFESSIILTSKPVLGTTPSTGASALVATQVGGTALTALAFVPVFATGTYSYAVTYTTQTSFAVKCTAASHTIKLYIDGVYIQDLSSGVESSSIAMAAAGSKLCTFVCYEAGKTPKTYNMMVGRVS